MNNNFEYVPVRVMRRKREEKMKRLNKIKKVIMFIMFLLVIGFMGKIECNDNMMMNRIDENNKVEFIKDMQLRCLHGEIDDVNICKGI